MFQSTCDCEEKKKEANCDCGREPTKYRRKKREKAKKARKARKTKKRAPAAAVSEINVNTNNLAAGSLSTATKIRFNYMMYVFFVQGLAGVGKDLMKISGKSITKLVNKKDDNGALFTMVVRITGAKNIVKGLGTFFGGLVLFIGYWQGACILSMFVLIPIPFMLWKVDNNLAVNIKKQPPTFRDVFTNISYNVCIILLILIFEIFLKFFII